MVLVALSSFAFAIVAVLQKEMPHNRKNSRRALVEVFISAFPVSFSCRAMSVLSAVLARHDHSVDPSSPVQALSIAPYFGEQHMHGLHAFGMPIP